MLHKLRRAMVRPGRDRIDGVVEVDESCWGGSEVGVKGRLTYKKTLIMVAAEVDGKGVGRIRLRTANELTKASANAFVPDMIEPGSTIRTDGLIVYENLPGYTHERSVRGTNPKAAAVLLPRAHRVASLLKRWLLGKHQGRSATSNSAIMSTNLSSGSTAALPPRGGSSFTASFNSPSRLRRRRSTKSTATTPSGWLSHVHTQ